MKQLGAIIILLVSFLQSTAQNPVNYDREKLLEYYQTQRYGEAAVYLQSLYPEETTDLKILGQMAYCYLMAGKLPEAEKGYLKIFAQQPGSIPVLFNLAAINSRRGNNLKAKNYYQQIVKLDSTNFNAYKQLASLYTKDTDSERVAYLQKANLLNPVEADLAYDLAHAYFKLENYEPGYEILTTAIAADTGNLILQQAILPIAIQLKKYDEVIRTGELLLSHESDANIIKNVAMAHYYQKNYDKALYYFNLLEAANAQTESSYYYTALSYRNLKNYKQAAEYAKKTIEAGISPNTSSYYALLGAVYEDDKQITLASTAYKNGLQFDINPVIYYNLGVLYEYRLKQKTNALKYYKLYLNTKPDPKTDKAQIDFVNNRISSLTVKH